MFALPPVSSDSPPPPAAGDEAAAADAFSALLRAVLGGQPRAAAEAEDATSGEGDVGDETPEAPAAGALAGMILAAPVEAAGDEEGGQAPADGEGGETETSQTTAPGRRVAARVVEVAAAAEGTTGEVEAQAGGVAADEAEGSEARGRTGTGSDTGTGRAEMLTLGQAEEADAEASPEGRSADDGAADEAAATTTRAQASRAASSRPEATGDEAEPPEAEPAPVRGARAATADPASGSRVEERSASAPAQLDPAAPEAGRVEAPARSERSPLVNRIIDIAERLERSAPPRQMTVEFGELRMSVSLRGDNAVRVAVLGEAGAGLEAGWRRDLADALAERGLDLEGDEPDDPRSDDPDGGRRDDGRRRSAYSPDARAGARRRALADGGLRL